MKKLTSILSVICLFLAGCATCPPADCLKVSEESLQRRQQQSRPVEAPEETQVISASANVLQDMGFTLDESESKLGLVVASKDRDATQAGQYVGATLITFMAALGGCKSDALSRVDAQQKIRASIVTQRSAIDPNKFVVRATFQRLVWNRAGLLSRVETLDEKELYEGFFDKLSKSAFFEEQNI
ncbi:MAG: hypothetical protein A2Y14_02335 [Verrucomicrobia bacterium GWF2_51_19]|nr:MAG: hypothetical protein A2Y14_02335 [Verrucomicrobia bacterium GWF2_51_19]HCJ11906.1 hypothetical protein [Opitutae bacterium]